VGRYQDAIVGFAELLIESSTLLRPEQEHSARHEMLLVELFESPERHDSTPVNSRVYYQFNHLQHGNYPDWMAIHLYRFLWRHRSLRLTATVMSRLKNAKAPVGCIAVLSALLPIAIVGARDESSHVPYAQLIAKLVETSASDMTLVAHALAPLCDSKIEEIMRTVSVFCSWRQSQTVDPVLASTDFIDWFGMFAMWPEHLVSAIPVDDVLPKLVAWFSVASGPSSSSVGHAQLGTLLQLSKNALPSLR
jgi:hypothetical protein